MTDTEAFFWGVGGSVAVEVVAVLQFFSASRVRLPERYRRLGFWIARLALAVIAGGLAVAYDIDKRILAANIGAATPALIMTFASGFNPPDAN